ncbi:MAG: DUF4056 domain-containing protein [Phycisphaerales bacterium]|nr:DUF4056 domain-containing protein [Phycisphaerales bacterium]
MKWDGLQFRWASVLAWMLLLIQAGCYPTLGPLARLGRHRGAVPIEETAPLLRIGSLPYPRPLLPVKAVDPSDLGRHVYEAGFAPFWPGEVSRGIVYTQRGGFLDIAHIRNSADLTRYVFIHIHQALQEQRAGVILVSAEPSLYHIFFQYPDEWCAMSPEDRAIAEHELAIRLSQRLAYLMSTWHEIITWYWYRALPPISERQSAFSYDDPPSHMVGIQLAGEVLRENADHYDEALTVALRDELTRLGAVEPMRTHQAVDAVRDKWWDGRTYTLRLRLVHSGIDGEVLRSWLVELDEDRDEESAPVIWMLPSLRDIDGRDWSRLAEVEIEPNIWEEEAIRRDLTLPEGNIRPDRDFPRLAAVIIAAEEERLQRETAEARDAQ